MKKGISTICIIIILAILLGLAYYFHGVGKKDKEVVIQNTEVETETVTPTVSEEKDLAEITFSCDNEKTFALNFVSVDNSPGPSSEEVEKISSTLVAEIHIEGKDVFFVKQSTESPHLFEDEENSLYLEGDEASLSVGEEKFENCLANS